jgi:hypothetical protein
MVVCILFVWRPGGESPMDRKHVSKEQAGALSRLVFNDCSAGKFSGAVFKVFYFLWWVERRPGFDRVQVTLDQIQKGAHVCRQTAIDALDALETAGVIHKIKKRVRMWISGVWKNLQGANVYVFFVPSESTHQTTKPCVDFCSFSLDVVAVDNGDNSQQHAARTEAKGALKRVRWRGIGF